MGTRKIFRIRRTVLFAIIIVVFGVPEDAAAALKQICALGIVCEDSRQLKTWQDNALIAPVPVPLFASLLLCT